MKNYQFLGESNTNQPMPIEGISRFNGKRIRRTQGIDHSEAPMAFGYPRFGDSKKASEKTRRFLVAG